LFTSRATAHSIFSRSPFLALGRCLSLCSLWHARAPRSLASSRVRLSACLHTLVLAAHSPIACTLLRPSPHMLSRSLLVVRPLLAASKVRVRARGDGICGGARARLLAASVSARGVLHACCTSFMHSGTPVHSCSTLPSMPERACAPANTDRCCSSMIIAPGQHLVVGGRCQQTRQWRHGCIPQH